MKFIDSIITYFYHMMKRHRKSKVIQDIQSGRWSRWAIGAVLLVILIFLFPRGQSFHFADMREGSISPRRIVAPYYFEILKTEEEYQRDRELAVQKIYPVFHLIKGRADELVVNLEQFFNEADGVRSAIRKNSALQPALQDSFFQKYPVGVVDALYRTKFIDPSGSTTIREWKEFQATVKTIFRDLLTVGVMDIGKAEVMNPDRRLKVTEEEDEFTYVFGDFYDMSEARAKAAELLNNAFTENRFFSRMGYSIVTFFLRPNLMYDKSIHEQRIDEAKARVPRSSGFVYEKDELIVDKNQRITPEIRKKLVSLAAKMVEIGLQEGGIKRFFPIIGKSFFVLVLFFALGIFIRQDKPEILRETKSFLLVSLVILLVGLSAFLLNQLNASEYLVPVALGAMLLATLFDSRFGFASVAVLSILAGGLWGNDFNLMAASFFVGIVGVIAIKRVRKRSQLMEAIFILAGANVLAISFLGFLRYLPLKDIVSQWLYGGISGLITPILAYGLLPLMESVFDITTDFSLLEMSNLNHPLLKKLSVQAPGTYHHSIIVGNLSEAAAQAIGTNSLLARVGSYYHDIGKIEKPEYFVENQISGENPHEKLTPRMSALILMNHVKKGLDLAEKYKLPSSLKQIISQHQGTTVMNFFYKKAVKANGSGEASEEDYRYPGPRPQTKEAAIVMLGDVVEAATRILKDPTHSRLKGIIEDLVDGRFQEGQLNESPLTLRDLERIKESFLTILAGRFHTRVEYPERDIQKNNPKTGKSREADSAN
jgi:putative nucleotidyltransferase with HDIG domain